MHSGQHPNYMIRKRVRIASITLITVTTFQIGLSSFAQQKPLPQNVSPVWGSAKYGTTQAAITTADSLKNKSQMAVAQGDFQPNWASLSQRNFPEWFQNAKFGIWAHWGPQAVPCYGDWYARNMYVENHGAYKAHLKKYGHPSEFGYKDVVNTWKADKFDADKLAQLTKKAGAKYFVALANHHDNFDCWNSKYQPWNSVNIGPKKDIVGLFKKAATKQGLRFGVSIHNINVWGWYDPCRGSDSTVTKAGIPYDGLQTIADGKGKWWEGYDPSDLYGPPHKGGQEGEQPSKAFMKNWLLRTKDLIDTYQPDILEFDQWWPSNIWRQWVKFDDITDANEVGNWVGMFILQHYFNQERKWHKGADEGIITLKGLKKESLGAATLVLERDYSKEIIPNTWQLEESMGDWFYQGEAAKYWSAARVVTTLAETVCRNGNLLLNVVLRPDGSVAGNQEATLLEVGRWLNTNGEAIYGSKPYKVMSEGPHRMKTRAEIKEEHLPNTPPVYTQEDIRFTTNKGAIYAIVLSQPTKEFSIKSVVGENVSSVELLGSKEKVNWKQTNDGLIVQPFHSTIQTELAVVYKIRLK